MAKKLSEDSMLNAADLDGDGIKEYLNWGEHYHVGASPLWKDVATQLGMTNGVDYGPAGSPEAATFYDPVFYLRKFRYYKVDSNRLIDKGNQIPAYTVLTGTFFGAELDKVNKSDTPIYTIIFSLISIFLALYYVFKKTINQNEKK